MQYNYNKKIAVFVKFSVFRTVGYILSYCIIFFDCTNKTVQLLIHVHVNYTGNKINNKMYKIKMATTHSQKSSFRYGQEHIMYS